MNERVVSQRPLTSSDSWLRFFLVANTATPVVRTTEAAKAQAMSLYFMVGRNERLEKQVVRRRGVSF